MPKPVRVQRAEEYLPWVHTLHMPEPVIICVLNVLRNGHAQTKPVIHNVDV